MDRLNNFPEEPLPDPNNLRQDFASCVLQGSPECLFVSGQGMGDSQAGHRRQMSQFCGQEGWCGDFNSERVMITAMVGLSLIGKTSSVLCVDCSEKRREVLPSCGSPGAVGRNPSSIRA